jgi:hypothetical protein
MTAVIGGGEQLGSGSRQLGWLGRSDLSAEVTVALIASRWRTGDSDERSEREGQNRGCLRGSEGRDCAPSVVDCGLARSASLLKYLWSEWRQEGQGHALVAMCCYK